ncbi:MAG: 2-dehydro-3-deoxygalactonokinase [Rhizobiaceae bacterium]|nr:2-dehydro-3-deoxygalactonokinase [Rhizobiaceae bacterium]
MTALRNDPAAIVIDWGTTSFRAYLTTDEGTVLGSLETGDGIQSCAPGGFEQLLLQRIGTWTEAHGALPVVALGMITSRSGWVEVPYVRCPAGVDELAAGVKEVALANGSRMIFLAGLTDPTRLPFPDVMRGEETQVLGSGLDRDRKVVLPGTHSKWAEVKCGTISRFQTFVTGEQFSLLTRHSFIARGMQPAGEADWAAFERGVRMIGENPAEADAFLSLIFSARTGMLAGELQPAEIVDYVSGLLIGLEFHQARGAGWWKDGDAIGIVGNDGLNDRYARAARLLGLEVREGSGEAAIAGALRIAVAAGLVKAPAMA